MDNIQAGGQHWAKLQQYYSRRYAGRKKNAFSPNKKYDKHTLGAYKECITCGPSS